MNLPTYQPGSLDLQPVNIGGMFQQAFQAAQVNALRGRSADMQERQFQQEEQDRLWTNENIRPLQLEQERLQSTSQRLAIEGQREQLAEHRRKAQDNLAGIVLTNTYDSIIDSAINQVNEAWQMPTAPAGQPSSDNPIGKITSYGYASDETPDSNSSAGIGAFVSDEEAARIRAGESTTNRLQPGDLAVSKDIRQKLQSMGVKPGENITLTYADGKTHTGRYMDHTADEWGGQALTGRFDIYSPDGKHATDGQPIVGFSKGDKPMTPVDPATLSQPNFARQLDAWREVTRIVADPVAKEMRGYKRAVATKLTIEADPFFKQALAAHDASERRSALASQIGNRLISANPQAANDFKRTYTQWSGVKMNPDERGGYHPTRADGTPLSEPELGALAQSWQSFAEGWKPGSNFVPTASQTQALAEYQKTKAIAQVDPKNTTAAADLLGAKAALLAHASASPGFRPLAEEALAEPQAAPAAAKPPPGSTPLPADAPPTLESIPTATSDAENAKTTKVNADWSNYKDQLAERIGVAYQPPAKDGKVSPPTRIMPSITPQNVKAVLAKKSGLTADDTAVINTLKKARQIIEDHPVRNEQNYIVPASYLFSQGLPTATIDGRKVSAREGLRAWADEILTVAGIDTKGTKKALEEAPSAEVEAKATKFLGK